MCRTLRLLGARFASTVLRQSTGYTRVRIEHRHSEQRALDRFVIARVQCRHPSVLNRTLAAAPCPRHIDQSCHQRSVRNACNAFQTPGLCTRYALDSSYKPHVIIRPDVRDNNPLALTSGSRTVRREKTRRRMSDFRSNECRVPACEDAVDCRICLDAAPLLDSGPPDG